MGLQEFLGIFIEGLQLLAKVSGAEKIHEATTLPFFNRNGQSIDFSPRYR
jgi:hypothetical protein